MSQPNTDVLDFSRYEDLETACPDGGYMFSHILRDPNAGQPRSVDAERWQLCAWHYTDDRRGERVFVIDQYGRLLKPDKLLNRKKKFYAEVAKIETWLDIQPSWLVLHWVVPMLGGKHDCKVVHRPAEITAEQAGRVRAIQRQIAKEWGENFRQYSQGTEEMLDPTVQWDLSLL